MMFINVSAQMDSRFYHPGKISLPIDGMEVEQVMLVKDSIQLTGIFIKPIGKPKATIFFLHGDSGNVSNYIFMVRPLVKDE